jgi:hypothetical protein
MVVVVIDHGRVIQVMLGSQCHGMVSQKPLPTSRELRHDLYNTTLA